MTMHIEMIAAISNFGAPKWKKPLKPIHLASCTVEKSSRPIGQATRVPIAMESSTAIWLTKPRKHRVITTMSSITRPASAMWETCP